MAYSQGRIVELFDAGGENAALLALDHKLNPQPGQYLMLKTESEILPVTVFPLNIQGERLGVLPASPVKWILGLEVTLRGPYGKGFNLPVVKSRVGLCAFNGTPIACLLPLIEKALSEGHEVTLVTDHHLADLPSAIEVLPVSQLKEMIAWADYLAGVTTITGLPELLAITSGSRKIPNRKQPDEILIFSETPCAGIAACGVCSVPTRTGWKHACKDGPVFKLTDLVLV